MCELIAFLCDRHTYKYKFNIYKIIYYFINL